jgi:hypothetical protein
MGTKPKVRGSPQAGKKKPKEKAQRERFIEAARAVGVDETGAEFERALSIIVPQKLGRKDHRSK